jgi:hypothetical protein
MLSPTAAQQLDLMVRILRLQQPRELDQETQMRQAAERPARLDKWLSHPKGSAPLYKDSPRP